MSPLKALESSFYPHPLIPSIERARLFGYSILRGELPFGRYEVMDPDGDCRYFNTDEELNEYLANSLPGCFIQEG